MQNVSQKVRIMPYDTSSDEKFESVKTQLLGILGEVEVVHRGSSSLNISGQDEIDVYIPVDKKDFEKYLKPLTHAFGNPRNTDHSQRIRFFSNVEGKKVDLFLIDRECEDWKNGLAFEKFLRENPDVLREYELFKEGLDGVTVAEYYENKNAFTEGVLGKIQSAI